MFIPEALPRLVTGIPGLDRVTGGGLPRGEVTLVAGTAGTGKTVMAGQFLASGVRDFAEPAVFVTLEERPEKLRRFMATMGWDVRSWEEQGLWRFVDASPAQEQEVVVGEDFDLTPLIARIAAVVNEVGAKRIALDSISNVLNRIGDSPRVRGELHRLVWSLEELDVTALATAERGHDYDGLTRFGIEEFVADNILVLRNVLRSESRRRTVEALKLRGAMHQTGEFPCAILPGQGIVIAATAQLELTHPSSDARVSLGNADVDAMCLGGAFRDSVILVSGPTGSGKSCFALQFACAAAADNGRSLVVGFEESPDQLTRSARLWGMDLATLQAAGQLRLLCQYPESRPLASHLIHISQAVEEFNPTRLVVDSLSGIERASDVRAFHEFVLGLTSFLKARQITTLFTTTTPWLLGGTASAVEASTLLDAIVLLRFVEVRGEVQRAIVVLKMRGSGHDRAIRQFAITDHGLEVGETFLDITGILSGRSEQVSEADLAGLAALVGPHSPIPQRRSPGSGGSLRLP